MLIVAFFYSYLPAFVAMFSVMVTQAPVGSQTAPPGSVVSRVSDGVDGASMFKPNISSPHPPDLERNLPDSDGASTAPAEQGPTSADNMEKPEIQDGAA
jgi:hypothetical protein